ncbi:MAG: hypothetical protein IJ180_11290 [Bacteroidales bacterium]|nr:hypothetical protein [Bacteroidales bacterium]MBQ9255340.1 hypothetical protein [Bacteroidales bacterium]
MSYSVRNVRNLYYAQDKKEKLYTDTDKKIKFESDGSWNAYKDREGCGYFECVENGHIVRTPKIERVTYVKVTPGSEMNSKIFTYTIKIDSAKIKENQTYTLSMIIPNFNGIDVGLENYVRGTYTAKSNGDTGVAEGIVNDIKKQKQAGVTDDPNISTPFLWDLFIDVDGMSADSSNGTITVSTKIDVPEEFEVGSWMPELQQRQLQFEFKPVYEDGVAEYYWGKLDSTTTSSANDYKHKLDSMEWFYNGERGEMERVRTLRDPLPKAKLHNFASKTDDYSVLDIHYRVDGDGSIMGDVDITIIVKEDDATSTTNAEAILTALKIGTATENKTIETFGA